MRVLAILGRTCSGKTTQAKHISELTSAKMISVGELIRERANREAEVHRKYLGKDGFSDAFVEEVIESALREVDQDAPVVIEGSIGLGLALKNLVLNAVVKELRTIVIDCSEAQREQRFFVRNRNEGRVEGDTFFRDREALFDRRLPADLDALEAVCSCYRVGCDGLTSISVAEFRDWLVR